MKKTIAKAFSIKVGLSLILPFCIVVIYSQQLSAAPWRFSADISGAEEYSNNTRSGGQTDQKFVTEISPGINIKRQGKRIGFDGRYQFQQRFVYDDKQNTNSNHTVRTALNTELWKNHFFVNASSNYTRSLTDPAGLLPLSTTSNSENLNDVWNSTINSRFISKFYRLAKTSATHTYNIRKQIDSNTSDTSSHAVSAIVANGPAFSRFSWSGTYHYSGGNAGKQNNITSHSALGRLGYLLMRGLNIGFTVGYEINPKLANDQSNTTSEGYVKTAFVNWTASRKWQFNAEYGERSFGETYDFQVNWYPTVRTSLNAGYGKGPFGNTYNGKFNHKTRKSIWNFEYRESITSRSFTDSFSLLGVSTDEDGNFILDDDTGNPIVEQFEIDVVVDDTYVRKLSKGDVTFSGKKTTVKVGGIYEKREYENLNYYDKLYTALVSLTRKLSPRADTGVDVRRNRNTLGLNSQSDKILTYSVFYNHQLGKKTQVAALARYLNRDSNNKSAEQQDYLARLQINITF